MNVSRKRKQQTGRGFLSLGRQANSSSGFIIRGNNHNITINKLNVSLRECYSCPHSHFEERSPKFYQEDAERPLDHSGTCGVAETDHHRDDLLVPSGKQESRDQKGHDEEMQQAETIPSCLDGSDFEENDLPVVSRKVAELDGSLEQQGVETEQQAKNSIFVPESPPEGDLHAQSGKKEALDQSLNHHDVNMEKSVKYPSSMAAIPLKQDYCAPPSMPTDSSIELHENPDELVHVLPDPTDDYSLGSNTCDVPPVSLESDSPDKHQSRAGGTWTGRSNDGGNGGGGHGGNGPSGGHGGSSGNHGGGNGGGDEPPRRNNKELYLSEDFGGDDSDSSDTEGEDPVTSSEAAILASSAKSSSHRGDGGDREKQPRENTFISSNDPRKETTDISDSESEDLTTRPAAPSGATRDIRGDTAGGIQSSAASDMNDNAANAEANDPLLTSVRGSKGEENGACKMPMVSSNGQTKAEGSEDVPFEFMERVCLLLNWPNVSHQLPIQWTETQQTYTTPPSGQPPPGTAVVGRTCKDDALSAGRSDDVHGDVTITMSSTTCEGIPLHLLRAIQGLLQALVRCTIGEPSEQLIRNDPGLLHTVRCLLRYLEVCWTSAASRRNPEYNQAYVPALPPPQPRPRPHLPPQQMQLQRKRLKASRRQLPSSKKPHRTPFNGKVKIWTKADTRRAGIRRTPARSFIRCSRHRRRRWRSVGRDPPPDGFNNDWHDRAGFHGQCSDNIELAGDPCQDAPHGSQGQQSQLYAGNNPAAGPAPQRFPPIRLQNNTRLWTQCEEDVEAATQSDSEDEGVVISLERPPQSRMRSAAVSPEQGPVLTEGRNPETSMIREQETFSTAEEVSVNVQDDVAATGNQPEGATGTTPAGVQATGETYDRCRLCRQPVAKESVYMCGHAYCPQCSPSQPGQDRSRCPLCENPAYSREPPV